MLTENEIRTIKKYVTPTLGRRKIDPIHHGEIIDYTHLIQTAGDTMQAIATDRHMLSTWTFHDLDHNRTQVEVGDLFKALKDSDPFAAKETKETDGAAVLGMFNQQREKLETANKTALVHVPTFKQRLRESRHVHRNRPGLDYIGLKHEEHESKNRFAPTGRALICAPNIRDGAWDENVKTFQLQRLQSLLARTGSTYARLSFGDSFTSSLLIESANRWNSPSGGRLEMSHLLMPCRYV